MLAAFLPGLAAGSAAAATAPIRSGGCVRLEDGSERYHEASSVRIETRAATKGAARASGW